jgi:hypothetical protein
LATFALKAELNFLRAPDIGYSLRNPVSYPVFPDHFSMLPVHAIRDFQFPSMDQLV